LTCCCTVLLGWNNELNELVLAPRRAVKVEACAGFDMKDGGLMRDWLLTYFDCGVASVKDAAYDFVSLGTLLYLPAV